jgi:hypothetical protein
MSKTVHAKPLRPMSYWTRHRLRKCMCGGYWFPHRRGGGACDYHLALRAGCTVQEAMELLTPDQLDMQHPLKKTPR